MDLRQKRHASCLALSLSSQSLLSNKELSYITSVTWTSDANSLLLSMGSGDICIGDMRMVRA